MQPIRDRQSAAPEKLKAYSPWCCPPVLYQLQSLWVLQLMGPREGCCALATLVDVESREDGERKSHAAQYDNKTVPEVSSVL